MSGLIAGLYEDWISLDERIDTIASEIEKISEKEANCQRLMSVPGIGPLISTAVVAAIGTGEAFERGRDFGAWLGLVPRKSQCSIGLCCEFLKIALVTQLGLSNPIRSRDFLPPCTNRIELIFRQETGRYGFSITTKVCGVRRSHDRRVHA